MVQELLVIGVAIWFVHLILIHEISTSPDGNFLVFLSARSSVDSGAHSATNSLHRIDWPKDVKLYQSAKVHDVVSFFYNQFNFNPNNCHGALLSIVTLAYFYMLILIKA